MTGPSVERRDEVLGAALRGLDVPEHRDAFHDAVRALLEREARDRRGGTPEPIGSPATPRGRPRRRWVLGLAAAAAVLILAVVVTIGVPGSPPELATAAEVRARVAEAWASADGVSGTLVIEGADQAREARGERGAWVEARWRFLLTGRGDFRLISGSDDVAYHAEANVQLSLSTSASIDSQVRFAAEITGLAPGPPDPGPSREILDRGLGSAVRALAAGGGGIVREVTYEGREAWLLDTELPEAIELSPSRLRVTVDRETGFPVRVVAFRDGRRVAETRIEDLRVNPPIPEGAFRLDLPGGMVSRTDYGFRPIALEDVPAVVGYEPLVPAGIPDGYRLSEVLVSTRPSPTGPLEGNPMVGDVVSLSYRRGLEQVVVTMRPVGGDPGAWMDPFDRGEGRVNEPERVRFSTGALGGHRGELVVDPVTPPHVWAVTDRLVVTVSGDLTGTELVHVAGSLERLGSP